MIIDDIFLEFQSSQILSTKISVTLYSVTIFRMNLLQPSFHQTGVEDLLLVLNRALLLSQDLYDFTFIIFNSLDNDISNCNFITV